MDGRFGGTGIAIQITDHGDWRHSSGDRFCACGTRRI